MKVLFSAGEKGDNIISGISKKFVSSGDSFLNIPYLEDIDKIFARGEYFDKAIITEQSMTHEYKIEDEDQIRLAINNFANTISKRGTKMEYVFLTQDEYMAEMIHEEILSIESQSVVVLAAPPYQVKFFTDLVVKDIKRLDPDIVYVPSVQETNIDLDDEVDITDEDLNTNTIVTTEMPDDIGNIFGVEDELGDNISIDNPSDLLGADNSTNDRDELDFKETNFDNFDDIDLGGSQETLDSENNTINNNQASEFSNDFDDFDFNNVPIEQSNQLPDYTKAAEETADPLVDFDDTTGVESSNVSFKDNNAPVVDDTPVSNNEFEQEFVEIPNMDNGFNNDDIDLSQYQNETPDDSQYQNNDFDNSQYQDNAVDESQYQNDMFGDDQYQDNNYGNDQYQNQDNQYQQNDMIGFSQDDYTSQEIVNNTENTQNQGQSNGFDEDYYNETPNQQEMLVENQGPQLVQETPQKKKGLFGFGEKKKGFIKKKDKPSKEQKKEEAKANKKFSPTNVKDVLAPFAARGNSIVVTGCGGCGTSFVAYNLANIINQLGYTVALVDLDTHGKTQSYISKPNYESMDPEESKLLVALNSTTGIGEDIAIVKQGFHLLTMGMATDSVNPEDLIKKEKIPRFMNTVKSSHNFVIYDIPFGAATTALSDIVYMSDNLVQVVDTSNWGLTKYMLSMTNIDSDDMTDTLFAKSQVVLNKQRNIKKLLGIPVRTGLEIMRAIDKKMIEILGDDPGVHFQDIRLAAIINDDPSIEDYWFEDVQYSDTGKGQAIFLELIHNIVMGK